MRWKTRYKRKNGKKGDRPIQSHSPCGAPDPASVRDIVVSSLDDDKALDVQVIDLGGLSALADYLVVASGTSSKQIVRMAEKLKERLEGRGCSEIRIEGAGQGNWVIVDVGDVIVHLFRPEVREFYNIEKMWSLPPAGLEGKTSSRVKTVR